MKRPNHFAASAHTLVVARPLKHQFGLTLIELMIAMVLGLFLVAGVFQLNLSNQKTSRLQEAIAQTQKNGRFAIDTLSHAVKSAGFSGFYRDLSDGVENLLNNPGDIRWDVATPLSGFNDVTPTDSIAGINGFVAGTDVLVIKGMSSLPVPVISHNAPNNLVADTPSRFNNGDIVIISDIDQASAFQINTATSNGVSTTLSLVSGAGTPGNSALLGNGYTADAELGHLELKLFYIKPGQNGNPALYSTELVNTGGVISLNEIELVSDIANLQVSYGVDTNNDLKLDNYSPANAVADWKQVLSVRISLLASSIKDNITDNKSSYSFEPLQAGFSKDLIPAATADKRLKRAFSAYVPLRNRTL